MNYYAHTIQYEDGAVKPESEWQGLKEHLENTAEIASRFAPAGLKNCAYIEGLLHDIGKYQQSFQERLHGLRKSVDHAVCGAKEAEKLFDLRNPVMSDFVSVYLKNADESTQKKIVTLLRASAIEYLYAYTIIGHHSGLPDKGTKGENEDSTALLERLKKDTEHYEAYKDKINISPEKIAETFEDIVNFFPKEYNVTGRDYEFLIRILFSCLVDADFLDTEKFCTGKTRPEPTIDWDECKKTTEDKFNSFPLDSEINRARREIRDRAMSNIKNDSPMYLLDTPTGSGKTLCSVSLALERARLKGKKRIIYVIPYTTVIEQTAAVIKKLFPGLTVLEHHCDFDFDSAEEDGVSATEKLKKAAENWDTPVIVTTNVQFFESIYSNRPGKLRKLHNIADSILIFDEIHTLPLKCFVPCMSAINQLTTNYGSEAMFLTATMPDFSVSVKRFTNSDFAAYDLVPDKTAYKAFENVTYEYVGKIDVPEALNSTVSNLVVCNRKKTALEYYRRCEDKNKYYLSTYMTPVHRFDVIGKIRDDLASGKKPVVFSTSLIEAGVDLDFDCAWRELSGLDNILQTAGRCNREGRRPRKESVVKVFETENNTSGDLAIRIQTTKGCINKYGMDGLSSPECMRDYFDRVYEAEDYVINVSREYMSDNFDVNFKKIAESFRMIDELTESVVVPNKKIEGLLAAVRQGLPVSKRKLQRHVATVNKKELENLIKLGAVTNYDGVNILDDETYYDADTGIITDGNAVTDYIY